MRTILLMTWLLLGLLGVFYHNGPGKNSLQLDDASQHIAHAEEAAQAGDWAQVDLEYSAALQSLPSDRVAEQQRIGIEVSPAVFNDWVPPVTASSRSLNKAIHYQGAIVIIGRAEAYRFAGRWRTAPT